MTLTDAQTRTCLNALRIAAERTEGDEYPALAQLLELELTAPHADPYGCICSDQERARHIAHVACPVHYIG